MCLIVLAFETHPLYRLILAANRDEFFARPSASAGFWEDDPRILAGRDLKDGGTWLGLTRGGRIAALTNYRDPGSEKRDAPSRGRLVKGFLQGKISVEEYHLFLSREGGSFNGFNLIFGDTRQLLWYSNRHESQQKLSPGIHGLSNHILDTPWPKVARSKNALAGIVEGGGEIPIESLFALLADRSLPPDEELPDTGVGIELERLLSPVFISSPTYGTRSSTIMLVDRENSITFVERTFNGRPEEPVDTRWQFRLDQDG
jgi:uncharacterized protein with NRDE domain